jgi:glycosyltransferase involved in cell wall biosynthesis
MSVSLIISTYNRPDALFRVLESVKLQTKLPDEIIVADDGSDKTTKDCVDDFSKSSSLKLIHSWQQDYGFRVAESRNKAISKSTCDYIILIDGDVILHNKFIEDHLSHAEFGFFVQGTRVFLDRTTSSSLLKNGVRLFSFFSKGLSNRKNAIYSIFFAKLFVTKKNHIVGIKTCNLAFYRKDCVEINGFNNDMVGWGREDTEFVVRLLNNGVNRKNVHFNLIQFHLWHQHSSKEFLSKNEEILKNTISNKLSWSVNGLNKFI